MILVSIFVGLLLILVLILGKSLQDMYKEYDKLYRDASIQCPICKGRGYLYPGDPSYEDLGLATQDAKCGTCDGEGRVLITKAAALHPNLHYVFKVREYTKPLTGRYNPRSKVFFIVRGDGEVMAEYDEYRIQWSFPIDMREDLL